MNFTIIDGVTGSPSPPKGYGGFTVTSLPDGSQITPDDQVVYDPPLQVLVADAGDVAIVPAGRDGDRSVIYPMGAWGTVPVMVKRVLAAGTTAGLIFGQKVYNAPPAEGPLADSTLVTADSTLISADRF